MKLLRVGQKGNEKPAAIDKDGKYIKHEKINDDMLNILKNGFFLPHKPEGE